MSSKKSSTSARVTMQDIAEKAGVTKATVSLALRKHSSISQSMQEKVAQLAEEMNYRPNPFVVEKLKVFQDERGGNALRVLDWGCGRGRTVLWLLEQGYDAVTVADIATRADYGRSTFYLYFQDKEAVVFIFLV